MTALDALLLVFVVYVATVTLYLVAVTVAASAFRKKEGGLSAPPPRIAVIVPAHNEALQIEPTISRISESDYPPERFAVYVIADNCDDATADLARGAGATVFERRDPENRGKGQALDWCIAAHPELLGGFDAVAVVDADSAVHPRFLREMAASLSHPDVLVAQGHNAVGNPRANWRTALVCAAFSLINRVRPIGRERLGGSAELNGNGMAFRTQVLKNHGWPAHSIVEDVEFTLLLLLDGIRVHYSPDAIVLTDMPLTRAQSTSQRRRWELGRLHLTRRYLPRLLRAFASRPRWRYLDACLNLLVPPLSMLVLGQGLLLAVTLMLDSIWAPVLVACLLGMAFHVTLGLYLSRVPPRVWVALLAVPLFLLWKSALYLRMLVSPSQRTWERAARPGDIEHGRDSRRDADGRRM